MTSIARALLLGILALALTGCVIPNTRATDHKLICRQVECAWIHQVERGTL